MKIITFVSPPMANNTYLLDCEDGFCYVIDPSFQTKSLLASIAKQNLKVKAVLLTHGHIDHIVGVDAVVDSHACPVYLAFADHEYLFDDELSGAAVYRRGFEFRAQFQDFDHFHDPLIQILPSPGHTPGGVAFYLPQLAVLIAGDTLFYEGLGRTDLPGGSKKDLLNSRNYLLSLPPETKILPGHEKATTVMHERQFHQLKK